MSRSWMGAGAGAVGVAALSAVLYATLIERTRFALRNHTLPVLPAGAKPVRILHVSDLHLAPWQHDKMHWVRALAELEPDLIVNTGDNFGHPDALDAIRATFAPFDGVPGVFVFGSNDYLSPMLRNPLRYLASNRVEPERTPDLDTDGLRRSLEALGWIDLDDRATSLAIGGVRFEFIGTGDAHICFDHLERLPAEVERMREETGVVLEPSVTIGVTHAPYQRVLDALVTYGAQAIFAGHTHGGQVKLPWGAPFVTNSDLPPSQASGVSVWRHAGRTALLDVSAGLGTSIYAPVRFGVPPEASLVTLVPAR